MSAGHSGDLSPDVVAVVDAAVLETFADVRRTVQRNLAVLTVTFLRVLGAARSGRVGVAKRWPGCPPPRQSAAA